MNRYRFELATPADDADLRRIMTETPMAGAIALSFRREPSFFASAAVDGRFRQVVAVRDTQVGRLVGFGCRSIRSRYVNGEPQPIGYLNSLRLLEAHRNRGLVARGYAFFKQLHDDGLAKLYLTTIAEDNRQALALLTSGRAGLPRYHDVGSYHTAVMPLRGSARNDHRIGRKWDIRPAAEEDLPRVLEFLQEVGPRRQFFPCYEATDFFREDSTFRELKPTDLLLAFHSGELIGTLAGWDQIAFRQTVVHDYARPLSWLRPLYNGWAKWRRLPTLPRPGQPFGYLTAALPVVKDDNTEIFAALLESLCERSAEGPHERLAIGLHADDPLMPVIRSRPTTWYITRLFLVGWEDGETLRRSLDTRVPYLELGTL